MNKNAKKWVKALRSGEYKQIKGTLQNKNGYCCLGVACDLYEKETGRKLSRNKKGFFTLRVLDNTFYPVRKWLNLKTPEGLYGNNQEQCLTIQNDHGYSFEKIANIIEKNKDSLFIKEKK